MFLKALRINRERLFSKSKVAVDARILRQLLQTIAASAPFSEAFYLEQNPDIAEAHAKGLISDLHAHFIEQGYFEGRTGSSPPVDERYYIAAYPDVAEAVRRGDVASGSEHYHRSGATEGRIPNSQVKREIEVWAAALRDDNGT